MRRCLSTSMLGQNNSIKTNINLQKTIESYNNIIKQKRSYDGYTFILYEFRTKRNLKLQNMYIFVPDFLASETSLRF